MTHAIDTHDLTKTFGRTVALNRLNLTVEPGEVHGFLGPNGAGKTTTLRILLGLIRPDSGEAIDVLTRLRGDGDPARISELCERFDLDRAKKARTYSKGNRQKVALVAALAGDADLLPYLRPAAEILTSGVLTPEALTTPPKDPS